MWKSGMPSQDPNLEWSQLAENSEDFSTYPMRVDHPIPCKYFSNIFKAIVQITQTKIEVSQSLGGKSHAFYFKRTVEAI